MTLPDAKLAELLAGCDGVTPGPWRNEVHELGSPIVKGDGCIATAHGSLAIVRTKLPHAENAAHIARCDPDTIRSLVTELTALRKANSGDVVLVPRETLKWWRKLVDLNPADLAPRLDAMLASAPSTGKGEDGWDQAIVAAAEMIECWQIQDTGDGQGLTPRAEGNRAGLAYANAIRALLITPAPRPADEGEKL